MSFRHTVVGSLSLATLVVSFAASGASGATLVGQSATGHCKKVGKGTAWSDQGQKGVQYTVEGSKASACAVGITWLVRLTKVQGAPKSPAGWDCISATRVAGVCTNNGTIFQWTAGAR
jgi:hypothetical protein